MTALTKYQTIYHDVKKGIKDGVYTPGVMFPTETELCQKYQVSRNTIRKAMSLLQRDGYVSIQQGHGTEVLSRSSTQLLSSVESVTTVLRAKGFKVSIENLSIQRILCPKMMQDYLKLTDEDEIIQIERMALADGIPVACLSNHLIADKFEGIEAYASGEYIGLYEFIYNTYGIKFDESDMTITTIAADFVDATMLRVPLGTPLFRTTGISFHSGAPFDYHEVRIIGDRYEYKLRIVN